MDSTADHVRLEQRVAALEAALADAQASGNGAYRELFERSADAILIIDGEDFVDCNEAAVKMLRLPDKSAVLRTHPSQLSPPVQPDGRASFEKANEMIATAFALGSHRFEWMHKRADGEVFPVEVLLTAVSEPGRRVLHVVWRDISDRKRLESQLQHNQKMQAIGKLTGGIAHDFNNLLVAILGSASLLSEILPDRPDAMELVQSITSASERAATLVKQLLAFGRRQEVAPQCLDLAALLREMRRLLERVIGEDVELRFRLPDEAVPVIADPGQVEQVMLNLSSNARDAMPHGGTLTSELDCVDRHETGSESPEESGSLPAGRYARLRLTDTGCGMDAATVQRAMEPFFTTKEVGDGTGLGLASAYGIIQGAGGDLRIQSEPGTGTCVTIWLPIVDDVPEPVTRSTRARVLVAPPRNETIMLVEDEPAVAEVGARLLRKAGYEVLVMPGTATALERYLEDPASIDLIVSDVIMPQKSGPEFIRELQERGHTPRVLFVSGHTADLLSTLRESDMLVDLLQKPFSARDLIARVRAALDRPDDIEG